MYQYLYFPKKVFSNGVLTIKSPLINLDEETMQYYFIKDDNIWNDEYNYIDQYRKIYLKKRECDDFKDYFIDIKKRQAIYDKERKEWFITKATTSQNNLLYLLGMYNKNYN